MFSTTTTMLAITVALPLAVTLRGFDAVGVNGG